MIKIQQPSTVGNEKAKYNTYPDPIKQHNWIFAENFEYYGGFPPSAPQRNNYDFETNPLGFFSGIRSYEYRTHYKQWEHYRRLAFDFGNFHSGATSLLIRTTALGEGEIGVNHGYWLESSLDKIRYWRFWLKIATATHDGFIDFAFDNYADNYDVPVGTFSRDIKGYFIYFRFDLDRFYLYRADGLSYTTLATHIISPPGFTHDWKEIVITELHGRIRIYYDNIEIISVVDNTYRNCNWFGAHSRTQSAENIAYLDDISIG